MISKIAFSFVTSTYGRYIILALGVASSLLLWNWKTAKKAEKKAVQKIREDHDERTIKGKEVFHESQSENAGRDTDAILNRVRGRDDHWGRM